MASYTLNTNVFPDGTSVGAYPDTNWPTPPPHGGAPVGSATSTKTVSSGTLEFTGLAAGTLYSAVAEVGGRYRYISFTTPTEEEEAGEGVSKEVVEAILAEKIGVELMSQTDPRVEALGTRGWGVIEHGENAETLRPSTPFARYYWVGTVFPKKALTGDFWFNPTGAVIEI